VIAQFSGREFVGGEFGGGSTGRPAAVCRSKALPVRRVGPHPGLAEYTSACSRRWGNKLGRSELAGLGTGAEGTE